MSTPTNHWKLGLFIVGSAALALCVAVYLGAARMGRQHVDYVTYFDESVQGLDVGSPVKFRGVKVGTVAKIDVAPDRRRVAVVAALGTEQLTGFRLSEGSGIRTRIIIPSDLRMQLVTQGLTGLKFVEIDFFDERQHPRPILPFTLPDNYIPAAESTLKNVEDAMVGATARLPEVLESLARVSEQSVRLMDEIERQRLPEIAGRTLTRLDELMSTMNRAVVDLDARRLSTQAQATIDRANAVLGRLDGDKGLLASAQRASDGLGDLAAMSPQLGEELAETMKDLRSAAASFQRVAEALERDPDMLIKGRRVAR